MTRNLRFRFALTIYVRGKKHHEAYNGIPFQPLKAGLVDFTSIFELVEK